MGAFDILKRGEFQTVIEFSDRNKELIIKSLRKQGKSIIDNVTGKEYASVTGLYRLTLKHDLKKGIHHVQLVDPDAGCSIDLEKDGKIMKMVTDANMVSKVLQGRLITQMFDIKRGVAEIIIVLIMGAVFGFFVGAFAGGVML
jgi:hypothetical protein